MEEHSNIVHRDWRHHALTSLAAPFRSQASGITHPVGTPVVRMTWLRLNEEDATFALPNPSALYLNLAGRAGEEGTRLAKEVTERIEVPRHVGIKAVPDGMEPLLFDCFEQMIACLVFSFLAVEAFANERVPDEFVYERKRDDGRCTERYDKGQIERTISLDEKLARVLPGICGVASPKGTTRWEQYVWLRDLRNRFVHLKTADWNAQTAEQGATAVWAALLREPVIDAPSRAASVIAHYYPNPSDTPRWVLRLAGKPWK